MNPRKPKPAPEEPFLIKREAVLEMVDTLGVDLCRSIESAQKRRQWSNRYELEKAQLLIICEISDAIMRLPRVKGEKK